MGTFHARTEFRGYQETFCEYIESELMETPEEAEVKVYIDDNKPEVEQVW